MDNSFVFGVLILYIFKINCIFILITFYFKILVYCTSNFVPICILESYRVLSVCITWYSFNYFLCWETILIICMIFVCAMKMPSFIISLPPTNIFYFVLLPELIFSTWFSHRLNHYKKNPDCDCLRGDFLPWQENHMKFMLHL